MKKKKQTQSILTPENIRTLESFCEGNKGYFGKMFDYLGNVIEEGVQQGRFTEDEARSDLEAALWYAYACNNIDDYEHYYLVSQWMPYSEPHAAGCGAWYYRYACSLMYCGRLKDALDYSERGVNEAPEYPWGWLQLAKLRSHFGDREGALEAVRRGLLLVPGDYEFLTLEKEINAGCSLEEMEFHYIDPGSDHMLQGGLLEDEYQKRLAIAGLVCNLEALEQIKALFSPMDWKPDCPYCTFTYWTQAYEFFCVFRMNEAAVSKLDLGWLKSEKENLDEDLYPTVLNCDGEECRLTSVIFDVDCSTLLCFTGVDTGKELSFKVKDSDNGVMS